MQPSPEGMPLDRPLTPAASGPALVRGTNRFRYSAICVEQATHREPTFGAGPETIAGLAEPEDVPLVRPQDLVCLPPALRILAAFGRLGRRVVQIKGPADHQAENQDRRSGAWIRPAPTFVTPWDRCALGLR